MGLRRQIRAKKWALTPPQPGLVQRGGSSSSPRCAFSMYGMHGPPGVPHFLSAEESAQTFLNCPP